MLEPSLKNFGYSFHREVGHTYWSELIEFASTLDFGNKVYKTRIKSFENAEVCKE